MKTLRIIITAVLSVSMLTGCNIYGKFKMPTDTELTQEYVKARDAQADTAAFGNLPWQQVFTDPVLTDLIYQALDRNVDLANAKLNVDIAHANLKGARLAYLPAVALSPNGAGASYSGNALNWSYQIPLSVSWEIDIFGKTLNNKRAAEASYQRAEQFRQATRSQIIGAVANTYYALVTLHNTLALQMETSDKWLETVNTMRALKAAGRVQEPAVQQSLAQYHSIQASIAATRNQLVALNNTMSLLMRENPREWQVDNTRELEVPQMLRESIPMRELAARPDVRAAEYALAAAYYQTALARAAFYPSLNISANGGFTNLLGSMIVNPGDWFVQLAGQLTAPLFNRGQNIARLEAARASQQQALNTFEQTLLSAATEVSNAMSTLATNEVRYQELLQQIDNLRTAADQTAILLQVGGGYNTTYLEVITARQSLLGAQMNALACEQARAQALINLYQSLGGGR